MMKLLAILLLLAPAPREPAVFPILEKDPRLSRKITLERSPETLGRLLQVVAQQTGVEIAAEGDFLSRKVLFQVKEREAREVLTDIGILAQGLWLKRKGAYLMAQQSAETGFI